MLFRSIAAAAFTGLAAAQSATSSAKASVSSASMAVSSGASSAAASSSGSMTMTGSATPVSSGPASTYTVDPNSVSQTNRTSWCTGQRNTCRQACDGTANTNNCDPMALTWECTCSNGNLPNITDYQQSLPAQECRAWQGQCIEDHPNDLDGQDTCMLVRCGNRTVIESHGTEVSSGMATGMTTSGSGSQSTGSSDSGSAQSTSASGSSGSSGSASSASGSGNAAMAVGVNYGTGILTSAFLGLFGLLL